MPGPKVFPAEHYIIMSRSVLFTSHVSGINVVADWCITALHSDLNISRRDKAITIQALLNSASENISINTNYSEF